MENEARAGDGLDSWLIGRLRQQPRRARGEEAVSRLLRPREATDVLARLEALEDATVDMALRLEELEGRHHAASPPSPQQQQQQEPEPATAPARIGRGPGHTFFVPTPTGYEIVDGEGAVPAVGASVTIDDRRYTVEGTRGTPLPLDRRPCLVLAPAVTADASGRG